MPRTLRRRLRLLLAPHPGWLAVVAALGLVLIGVVAIGLGQPASADFAAKQLAYLPVALLLMAVAAVLPPRLLVDLAYPALALAMVMLVVLLLPFMPAAFVPVRNGARRWFDLQLLSVQPSELAKIAYVLALAAWLRYRENYRAVRGLLPPLILTFVPMGLIVVEPDLGTALLFLPALFAMLIAAGAKLKHLLAMLLIGLALLPAMYPLLQPHQKQRIVAMVSQVRGETRHRSGIGFQGYKAKTLVGAGQLTGHNAPHAHNLIHYNDLPEAWNDMIFAVICTRFGAAGGAGVVALYLLFVAGGLGCAAVTRDPFARIVAVGITAVVFAQMFVNVGMTLGILPITGMTLPFVSYGGSSLVANFIMLGLLLNVASRRSAIIPQPAFEFDRPRNEPVHRNPHGDPMAPGK